MLTALAFAHFSSELLLKEQMIIPVKKKTTLNNQRNRLFFTDCFLAKFPPEICREIGPEIGRFFWEFAPENPSI